MNKTIPKEFYNIAKTLGLKRAEANEQTRNSNLAYKTYFNKAANKVDFIGCLAELIATFELMKAGKGFKMAALFDLNPLKEPDLVTNTKDGKELRIDVKGTESNYKRVNTLKIKKATKTGINCYWFIKLDLKQNTYISNFNTLEEVKTWNTKQLNDFNIWHEKEFNN